MEVQKSEDKLELEKFYYDHPCFQALFKSKFFLNYTNSINKIYFIENLLISEYEAFIELRETKTEPETLQSSLICKNIFL